jgi:hypothetical protein
LPRDHEFSGVFVRGLNRNPKRKRGNALPDVPAMANVPSLTLRGRKFF